MTLSRGLVNSILLETSNRHWRAVQVQALMLTALTEFPDIFPQFQQRMVPQQRFWLPLISLLSQVIIEGRHPPLTRMQRHKRTLDRGSIQTWSDQTYLEHMNPKLKTPSYNPNCCFGLT